MADDSGAVASFPAMARSRPLKSRARTGLAEAVRKQTVALTEARFRDAVTGLFNRAMLLEVVRERVSESGGGFALLAVGLKQIETVRESHGQAAADVVLKALSERLAQHVRAADVLARIGDQTLMLMLGQIERPDQAEVIAQRVLTDLARPVDIGDAVVYVSAGIGVSLFPADGKEAEALVNNAESAMRRTVPPGEALCFYSSEFNAEAHARVSIEAALRRAVEEQRFELHYQPRVDARTGRIVSAEALMRWNEPELGPISPAVFVPLLESTGLIVPAGSWVITEAVRTLERWHRLDPQMSISINVSAMQFKGPSVAGLICDALCDAGMSPDCGLVEVEVTESLLLREGERGHLNDLVDASISLAIDDFGTGYSALGYLLDMPFDVLKVDRSFVTRLASEPHVVNVMHAIVAMAHALNMSVVAEGVETQAEFDRLVTLECDQIQGYLTGRPAPGADMDALLRA